ncbi:MAG: EamA family transporter [Candidatus Bathyarchaeia archaeon]
MRCRVSLSRENFRLFGKAALFMRGGWLCSLYALRYGQVIVVASLLNTEPMFVLFFTHLFLKRLERVTLRLTIGTIVTLLGVLSITTF